MTVSKYVTEKMKKHGVGSQYISDLQRIEKFAQGNAQDNSGFERIQQYAKYPKEFCAIYEELNFELLKTFKSNLKVAESDYKRFAVQTRKERFSELLKELCKSNSKDMKEKQFYKKYGELHDKFFVSTKDVRKIRHAFEKQKTIPVYTLFKQLTMSEEKFCFAILQLKIEGFLYEVRSHILRKL